MKNIIGSPAIGKDFYPRKNIIDKIYRSLLNGENIYLSAARRMGKTSIMQHLKDHPEKGFEFIYLDTESISDAETFFEKVASEIRKSKFHGRITFYPIKKFFRRIKKLSAGKTGVELDDNKKDKTQIAFDDLSKLLTSLKKRKSKLILMIDEIPETLSNIFREKGIDKAKQFLQFNRELRQNKPNSICFILTGSIGLFGLTKRLNSTKEINDINTIEVEPLNREEAITLFTNVLQNEKINCSQEVIKYALDKIEYFSPFYIQLIARNLIDDFYENNSIPNQDSVNNAFNQATGNRSNQYFDDYVNRLEKPFKVEELSFVKELLKKLSSLTSLELEVIKSLAKEHSISDCSSILDTLEADGYLQADSQQNYRFTSPLLKLWWAQYVK